MQKTKPSTINRVNKLLADAPMDVKERFLYDDYSLICFTNQRIGDEIAQKIYSIAGKDAIITDIMCSIGGNVIPFAKIFQRVNAIEVDSQRVEMLKHNLRLFGIENVNIICGYYQDVVNDIDTDVAFIDPPWGVNYKSHINLRIMVENARGQVYPLESSLRDLTGAKYIVVKLPLNYDMRYFESKTIGIFTIIAEKEFARPNSMRIVIMFRNKK